MPTKLTNTTQRTKAVKLEGGGVLMLPPGTKKTVDGNVVNGDALADSGVLVQVVEAKKATPAPESTAAKAPPPPPPAPKKG